MNTAIPLGQKGHQQAHFTQEGHGKIRVMPDDGARIIEQIRQLDRLPFGTCLGRMRPIERLAHCAITVFGAADIGQHLHQSANIRPEVIVDLSLRDGRIIDHIMQPGGCHGLGPPTGCRHDQRDRLWMDDVIPTVIFAFLPDRGMGSGREDPGATDKVVHELFSLVHLPPHTGSNPNIQPERCAASEPSDQPLGLNRIVRPRLKPAPSQAMTMAQSRHSVEA